MYSYALMRLVDFTTQWPLQGFVKLSQIALCACDVLQTITRVGVSCTVFISAAIFNHQLTIIFPSHQDENCIFKLLLYNISKFVFSVLEHQDDLIGSLLLP